MGLVWFAGEIYIIIGWSVYSLEIDGLIRHYIYPI